MRSMNTRITLPAWWKHGVAGRRARSRLADRVATGLLWTLALAVVVMLTYVILYLLLRGLNVLSWRFIATANANQDTVGPEVFNTFYIVVLALMICLPFAMGAAIYLVEYASAPRFVRLVRFATETLAGIPSIILALFGFLFFVTQFGHGTRFGFSRLAGALTLVILNLPLLLRVTEDALRSVPNDLREASVALGANKLQTVFKTLIPASLPSLTTGVILTAGKMIGETAALIYTAGGSSSVNGWFSLNPMIPGDTLTVHLFELQAEGIARNALRIENGTATLLILLLLTFNLGLRAAAGALNRRFAGSR
ncbi:MAG TPA: phosphate ABC transporter permease PstA [Ktedonobacterales bacterium]